MKMDLEVYAVSITEKENRQKKQFRLVFYIILQNFLEIQYLIKLTVNYLNI